MTLNIFSFINIDVIINTCSNPSNKELVRTFLLRQQARIVAGHRDQNLAGRWDLFVISDKINNEIRDIFDLSKSELKFLVEKDHLYIHVNNFYSYWPNHAQVNRERSCCFEQFCLDHNIH
jgi:hypothetical protein